MDETESARRFLMPDMPAYLAERLMRGEQVWTTDELRRDFEVIGFMAPFVVVRRKSDGQRGSLMFTHSPRYYFGWQPE